MASSPSDRISIDPNICVGKTCIRGHRIWVSLVLDFLAEGVSVESLLRECSQLGAVDFHACQAYAALQGGR